MIGEIILAVTLLGSVLLVGVFLMKCAIECFRDGEYMFASVHLIPILLFVGALLKSLGI
ncbi:hypothetical protein [Mammaliicoccus sciuri]|uniref:hypothetical protein n=1 Tax=Mammaliicoccus sciuri TaxID=1296 RepID=UPI002B2583D2|nr:hypothetical protein [Mammaliicoccus sciuri]WQK64288.1 hypothetical protein P3U20_04910 [Mammaliicoccus sciuri]